MQPRVDRRRFLRTSSMLSVAALTMGSTRLARAEAQAAVLLSPSPADLFRVRMEMTLEGNVDVPKNPLVSRERERQLPIEATSVIDFEERLTRGEDHRPAAANRYYYEAHSKSTIGGRTHAAELRKEARRVTARLAQGPCTIIGNNEYLTHEELDLLQSPICSLAIDSLLPTAAVRRGDTWKLDDAPLAHLLNLDAVQKSTLTGEVVAIDQDAAKLQIQGRIDGSIDGVPTAIDVAGKITFDRRAKAVTWVAMAVREKRDIGIAKPGFQIGATIKLIRQPLDAANAVKEETPVDLARSIESHKLQVQIDSRNGQFNTFVDRRWRMLSDAPGLTTMRMIANDKALAQCDIRELPRMKAGEQLTLAAFQSDVQKSLGDRFGEFTEAEEGVNGGGLRTMRVAVVGVVQEVPVQWVFLHFSDDHGRRIGATFTLESTQVEAFAGSDAQLANSLRFTGTAPNEPAAASGAEEEQAKAVTEQQIAR